LAQGTRRQALAITIRRRLSPTLLEQLIEGGNKTPRLVQTLSMLNTTGTETSSSQDGSVTLD